MPGKAKKFAALAKKAADNDADQRAAKAQKVPLYEARYQRENKEREKAAEAAQREWKELFFGERPLRSFDKTDLIFGAKIMDYPLMRDIPEPFHETYHPAHKAASSLFFKGGHFADVGRKAKKGYDTAQIRFTLAVLLNSFDPQHEHKMAACAWFIDTYTETLP